MQRDAVPGLARETPRLTEVSVLPLPPLSPSTQITLRTAWSWARSCRACA